ncbi:MAG TPA: molybdenum ABC transporter permease [Verrucomicrobiales bacterium]|nr:molybdenum ABC transporter permease [Verrucomicrobiales bacterium]
MFGAGLFTAPDDEVTLLAVESGRPVTASLRPEVRLSGIAVTNNLATLTTDEPHGLLWGEFIRVSDADAAGWDGVREIADTTLHQISFALDSDGAQAGSLGLSKPNPLVQALRSRDIRFSIKLSLISCTLTTLFSLWVAVPIGYVMSRFQFRGKAVIDTLLDIPIVLPPLVVGLSLLILFRYMPEWLSDFVVYKWPAVVLAQFMVACAFAVRTMRVTFDQIPQRFEQVALTLGCNRRQAFWRVIMPQAKGGLLAAGTLAWARALGEFGPILVFAGATRQKTEVLPTSAFLELQAGRTEGMLAVSLIMIAAAAVVFIIARTLGMKRIFA